MGRRKPAGQGTQFSNPALIPGQLEPSHEIALLVPDNQLLSFHD